MKYESGCLLNSFALINGPSGFGLSGRGVQLACVAALGLKDGSVGETKEYREGCSYMNGWEAPIFCKRMSGVLMLE